MNSLAQVISKSNNPLRKTPSKTWRGPSPSECEELFSQQSTVIPAQMAMKLKEMALWASELSMLKEEGFFLAQTEKNW